MRCSGVTNPPDVVLDQATPEHADLLANLLELYVHDLSEIFPNEIGADGRFGYSWLPLYWSDPDTHFAFLIKYRDHVSGFALVTRGSPATDNPDDLDVAEFFVLRSKRRAGVGWRAANLLWDRLRGRWVVRVAETNRAGVPFWEATVREYTKGAFTRTSHPGKDQMFRVFSFDSRSDASGLVQSDREDAGC
jgi:predicted acetyltransferase